MRLNRIEVIAEKFLESLDITSFPVPVESIPSMINLNVKESDLGTGVSGLLVIKNGIGTIGVNYQDGSLRRRFTIAHELGHFILHRGTSDLFIDKGPTVHYRNRKSSTGEDIQEMEANSFAAALLMPHKMLVAEIRRASIDLDDDDSLRQLAANFGVSTLAMSYRITNLNL